MRLCEYVRRICDSNAVQIGHEIGFVITVKFGCTKIWATVNVNKIMLYLLNWFSITDADSRQQKLSNFIAQVSNHYS